MDENSLPNLRVGALQIRTAISTPTFALAFACALAAWFAGSDLILVIPALVIGWIFVSIGLYSSASVQPKWPWIVISFFLFSAQGIFLYIHYKSEPEDLRVSFQFANQPPNTISIVYQFLNLGKHSVLINGVGLLETVAINEKQDPLENIALCNQMNGLSIIMAQMSQMMMGPGAQIGNELVRNSIYGPQRVEVDGVEWPNKKPLVIDSGGRKTLTAKFQLITEHRKETDTLVLCPLIAVLDLKNIPGVAICQGAIQNVSVSGTDRVGVRISSNTISQQFRILPHSPSPTCPAP